MSFRSAPRTTLVRAATLLLVLVALPAQPSAHDVPADTTVRMFIKPDGNRLHILARVQMASINDVDWPMHKDGYLDLPRIDPFLRDAGTMWLSDYMEVYEGDRKLGPPEVPAVRLVPDGDLSFEETYDVAAAHMFGPKIPDSTTLFPLQGLLDVMFDYAITSPASSFSINPRFDRLGLRVTTVLQFTRANGATRSFEYVGVPGLVRLDPAWNQAAWRFTELGFFHLLDNADALLFLLCLVVPLSQARGLIPIAGSFLAGESVTFIASAAYGMAPTSLWFQPFVATICALSIFYAAIENILGARLDRRWAVALIFGLAHGFAFSFALQPVLQFAGSHPGVSIVTYCLGIAAAALVVFALVVFVLDLVFRFVAEERVGAIVLSAIVAHTAWHSLADRFVNLRKYRFGWPTLDLLFLASALRWMMAAVVLAAAVWLIGLWRGRKERVSDTERRANYPAGGLAPENRGLGDR